MNDKSFVVAVSEESQGKRLDVFLASKITNVSRARLQTMINNGLVKVSGVVRKPGYRLKTSEIISVERKPWLEETAKLQPENIPLKIIYHDKDVIVIDKPSGLVVHPGAGIESGTLVNALIFHFPDIAGIGKEGRPGIVHRLDRDTSGVMVVAKSERAFRSLLYQFKRRLIDKTYLALVWGQMRQTEGKIDWPLGRHFKHGWKISTRTRNPKPASTYFQVLRIFKDTTLVEIKPVTGRTHQIRVHLADAGFPVVGDPIYGHKKETHISPRLFLHANILSFIHPETGLRLEFGSPLPPDLENVLEKQASGSA